MLHKVIFYRCGCSLLKDMDSPCVCLISSSY